MAFHFPILPRTAIAYSIPALLFMLSLFWFKKKKDTRRKSDELSSQLTVNPLTPSDDRTICAGQLSEIAIPAVTEPRRPLEDGLAGDVSGIVEETAEVCIVTAEGNEGIRVEDEEGKFSIKKNLTGGDRAAAAAASGEMTNLASAVVSADSEIIAEKDVGDDDDGDGFPGRTGDVIRAEEVEEIYSSAVSQQTMAVIAESGVALLSNYSNEGLDSEDSSATIVNSDDVTGADNGEPDNADSKKNDGVDKIVDETADNSVYLNISAACFPDKRIDPLLDSHILGAEHNAAKLALPNEESTFNADSTLLLQKSLDKLQIQTDDIFYSAEDMALVVTDDSSGKSIDSDEIIIGNDDSGAEDVCILQNDSIEETKLDNVNSRLTGGGKSSECAISESESTAINETVGESEEVLSNNCHWQSVLEQQSSDIVKDHRDETLDLDCVPSAYNSQIELATTSADPTNHDAILPPSILQVWPDALGVIAHVNLNASGSASHSPSEDMIDSFQNNTIIADGLSEGSSDSGKGGSDIHVPGGSLAGQDVYDNEVYEFEIPQDLCGRLIGKGGTAVNRIKALSNTQIYVKRHPYSPQLKVCAVIGTVADIETALQILRKKFPIKLFPAITFLPLNAFPRNVFSRSIAESLQQLQLIEGIFLDVIVSSTVSAGHFFLQQPTHPSYHNLERLREQMLVCYSQDGHPDLPRPVGIASVCASPAAEGWYRAGIVEYYEETDQCHVKYLDFGGYAVVPASMLKQLRGDFLELPLQASECYLSNVTPIDENGWSLESFSAFEELAQGLILKARIVTYAANGLPMVELFSIQGASQKFINWELVELGHAKWLEASP